MIRKYLLATALTIVFAFAYPIDAGAQYLISSEHLGSRTEAQLEALIGMPPRSAVELYKIRYMTTDIHGETDTASGLLVLPDMPVKSTYPMVIYQHGTTNGPSDCPSRLSAGSAEAQAYGAMGYVTIAPDYLGLGDNDAFHPYVHAATEASAALDMLFAANEWLDAETGSAWVGELFVAGYSQGGHAAAALQRELETHWSLVYPVTASTPMSGPYSISGVMYDRIVSDEIYFTPAYIAYVALAYNEVYGNLFDTPSEMFETPYLPAINQFYNGQITLYDLNLSLVAALIFSGGAVRPKEMFIDSVLDHIIADPDHPFRIALRNNDVYDWAPSAPTRLYYCTMDEQVPYQNTLFADSVMQMLGAADLAIENLGALSHGNCAPPALAASITFFDSFVLPLGTDEAGRSEQRAFIRQNPARHILSFDPDMSGQLTDFTLFDTGGRIILHRDILNTGSIDIASVPTGAYLATARSGEQLLRQKVIILQ